MGRSGHAVRGFPRQVNGASRGLPGDDAAGVLVAPVAALPVGVGRRTVGETRALMEGKKSGDSAKSTAVGIQRWRGRYMFSFGTGRRGPRTGGGCRRASAVRGSTPTHC